MFLYAVLIKYPYHRRRPPVTKYCIAKSEEDAAKYQEIKPFGGLYL